MQHEGFRVGKKSFATEGFFNNLNGGLYGGFFFFLEVLIIIIRSGLVWPCLEAWWVEYVARGSIFCELVKG